MSWKLVDNWLNQPNSFAMIKVNLGRGLQSISQVRFSFLLPRFILPSELPLSKLAFSIQKKYVYSLLLLCCIITKVSAVPRQHAVIAIFLKNNSTLQTTIFLQIFLINIYMKPEVTPTNYLYTWRTIECFLSIGPHADSIGPALGRQSVLQVCPLVSWL